jgi:hypothetical protein
MKLVLKLIVCVKLHLHPVIRHWFEYRWKYMDICLLFPVLSSLKAFDFLYPPSKET